MSSNSTKNFFQFLKGTEIELDINEMLDEDQKEALKNVIMQNLSVDMLRTFLDNNLDLNDNGRKLVFKVWKAHG